MAKASLRYVIKWNGVRFFFNIQFNGNKRQKIDSPYESKFQFGRTRIDALSREFACELKCHSQASMAIDVWIGSFSIHNIVILNVWFCIWRNETRITSQQLRNLNKTQNMDKNSSKKCMWWCLEMSQFFWRDSSKTDLCYMGFIFSGTFLFSNVKINRKSLKITNGALLALKI